jgi:hypothetical protein
LEEKIFLPKRLDGIIFCCSIAVMDENKTEKELTGSVKIDPKVYKEMADLCKAKGWVISVFVTEAVKNKLLSVKDQQLNNS